MVLNAHLRVCTLHASEQRTVLVGDGLAGSARPQVYSHQAGQDGGATTELNGVSCQERIAAACSREASFLACILEASLVGGRHLENSAAIAAVAANTCVHVQA